MLIIGQALAHDSVSAIPHVASWDFQMAILTLQGARTWIIHPASFTAFRRMEMLQREVRHLLQRSTPRRSMELRVAR